METPMKLARASAFLIDGGKKFDEMFGLKIPNRI